MQKIKYWHVYTAVGNDFRGFSFSKHEDAIAFSKGKKRDNANNSSSDAQVECIEFDVYDSMDEAKDVFKSRLVDAALSKLNSNERELLLEAGIIREIPKV